jgi:hypothetical protein
MRWLHIYLSMVGLAVVLFFSATGITLNHPAWFDGSAERRVEHEGQLVVEWLRASASPRSGASDHDAGAAGQVAKLEIVEHLRRAHGVRGALTDFRVDDNECLVSFKGPGYAADAFIDRESGRYQLTETLHGLVAVLNDLHKGRDTGPAWSAVIDVSAVILTAISLSGLVLLFYLKLRRASGVVVALAATVIVIALYRFWVP